MFHSVSCLVFVSINHMDSMSLRKREPKCLFVDMVVEKMKMVKKRIE